MYRHRQGKHHIALVSQKIPVKPLEHQEKAHEANAHHRHDVGDHHQRPQDPQQRKAGDAEHLNGKIGARGSGQQHQEQQPHHAAGSTKFVLYKFHQHLNTSRNSASTLMPFSSRIWSTPAWSISWPRFRKSTSSSTFSTSAMRWVEITTAASGL